MKITISQEGSNPIIIRSVEANKPDKNKNEEVDILIMKKKVNKSTFDISNLYRISDIKENTLIITSLKDKTSINIVLNDFIKIYNDFHYSQYKLDKSSWKPTIKSSTKAFIKSFKNVCKYIIDYDIKDTNVRGFISYAPFGKNSISIAELFTNSNSRHKGVASNLIKCIENIAISKHVDYLVLGVEENNNDAINMYKHYGFEETTEDI